MANRQRITTDISTLFPGDTITIGDQVLDIQPLNFSQFAALSRKLKAFMKFFEEEGVTLDNYAEPDKFVSFANILLDKFPEVLEEASNIAIDDLKKLPINVVLNLVEKVVEVNIQSNENFQGNLQSLLGKFQMIQQTPKEKSPKRSKS